MKGNLNLHAAKKAKNDEYYTMYCDKEETMDRNELDKILQYHKRMNLSGVELFGANLFAADLRRCNLQGAKLCDANMRGADLRGADLRGADLRGANLLGAVLREADLRHANLCGANLRKANFLGADLWGAVLREADLQGADLREAYCAGTIFANADLRGADLRGAILWNADTDGMETDAETKTDWPMACPETGSFIGWKKAGEYIVKLEIPEDAKRSSATTSKCRASKARVLEIQRIKGTKADVTEAKSSLGKTYKIGEMVYPDYWDYNRWNECSHGIHFFMMREGAVEW